MYDRLDVTDHRLALADAAERRRARRAAPLHPAGALTRARVGLGYSVVGLGLRIAAPAGRPELQRA